MKKHIGQTKQKKTKDTLERRLNEPFRQDEELMRLAWSMSAYVALDSCSPVYVGM